LFLFHRITFLHPSLSQKARVGVEIILSPLGERVRVRVMLNPSLVILNEVKDLRVDSVKHLSLPVPPYFFLSSGLA
jgi:hypothetical protein